MSIVRVQKRDTPFVVIDKTVLEDEGLSFKAKGLAAYLLSKPDNWQINVRHLSKVGTDGKAAVQSALNELEAAGYLTRTRTRNQDGTFTWESVLYEVPSTGGEAPCTGFPDTDNPDMENPDTDNRSLINNKEVSNEEINNEVVVVTGERTNEAGFPSDDLPAKFDRSLAVQEYEQTFGLPSITEVQKANQLCEQINDEDMVREVFKRARDQLRKGTRVKDRIRYIRGIWENALEEADDGQATQRHANGRRGATQRHRQRSSHSQAGTGERYSEYDKWAGFA